MNQLTMATSTALDAFNATVRAETALNSVMEFDDGDISDKQRRSGFGQRTPQRIRPRADYCYAYWLQY